MVLREDADITTEVEQRDDPQQMRVGEEPILASTHSEDTAMLDRPEAEQEGEKLEALRCLGSLATPEHRGCSPSTTRALVHRDFSDDDQEGLQASGDHSTALPGEETYPHTAETHRLESGG